MVDAGTNVLNMKIILNKNRISHLVNQAVHINLIHRTDKDMVRALSDREIKKGNHLRRAKRNNA